MLSLIIRVAAATAAVGFGAGIFAHQKARKAGEAIKEKISKTKTEIIQVRLPKGVSIEDCRIALYVPIDENER